MKSYKKLKYVGSALMLSTILLSCEDSIDKDNPPVPYAEIGGYANSDEIASSSLVAKLSFENNLTDAKNNITDGMPTNIAYVAGVKGNAYDGSSSQMRYAIGNATTAITNLNSFTLSFWMKSANTVDPVIPGQGKGAQGIFSIVRPTEFWGGINVFLENPDSSKPDRLRLKLGVENGRPGVSWKGQNVIMNIDGQKNNWVHITMSYNAITSRVSCYVNGEPASNLVGFAYAPAAGLQGSAPWYASDPGDINNSGGAAQGYGQLQMVGTNGKVVFGSHQFETMPPLNNGSQQDWATSFAGQLDEFRIYNTALSNGDVIALYKLEKDNR
ncbi:LamG domain-containing protein [Chryseobacterium sp. PBS4-4]|uniref:LamG domain-containing protein n=1 Tax=Chryseobacterium edaphi TaxID=2976532 RepID=A0ABT2W4Y4_9FLAO|nr:LamG domain-containing protein [Chryseobacterium edaphi]MCU7617024.1 LamG domain-containing protein [Chryseobacterium edaphi]